MDFERLSTCIKDAGIAIRHSRGRILFYTAGSRNRLEGNGHWWASGGIAHKKEVVPKKNQLFVIYIYEDAKQGQKVAPDLVESIMKGSGRVKESLRRILWKMNQFRPDIQKTRFQLYGFRKSDGFPLEANASLLANKF